jgi:hypothetical protein
MTRIPFQRTTTARSPAADDSGMDKSAAHGTSRVLPLVRERERAPKMKTWKPATAGILTIMAGAFIVWYRSGWLIRTGEAFNLIPVALGLIAIAGGICATRRKVWGLALAGAACAIYPPHPWQDFSWTPILGIAALVLLALSRTEFPSSVSGMVKAAHSQASDSGTGHSQ